MRLLEVLQPPEVEGMIAVEEEEGCLSAPEEGSLKAPEGVTWKKMEVKVKSVKGKS